MIDPYTRYDAEERLRDYEARDIFLGALTGCALVPLLWAGVWIVWAVFGG